MLKKCRREDYPRVCGGTAVRIRSNSPGYGLSPRVRGNPINFSFRAPDQRTIPACAGEPVVAIEINSQCRDYPRVCGGTWKVFMSAIPILGLSPRVRGNLESVYVSNSDSGTIPACAGEPAI